MQAGHLAKQEGALLLAASDEAETGLVVHDAQFELKHQHQLEVFLLGQLHVRALPQHVSETERLLVSDAHRRRKYKLNDPIGRGKFGEVWRASCAERPDEPCAPPAKPCVAHLMQPQPQ